MNLIKHTNDPNPKELKSGSVTNKKTDLINKPDPPPQRVENWVGHEQKPKNLINFRPPFPPPPPPPPKAQKKKEKQNREVGRKYRCKKVSKAAPSTPSKYLVSTSPQVVWIRFT
jgi:hypothetical protein